MTPSNPSTPFFSKQENMACSTQTFTDSSVPPRKDWGKAFEEMHKNGDDKLLIDDVFDDETFEEANFDEKE